MIRKNEELLKEVNKNTGTKEKSGTLLEVLVLLIFLLIIGGVLIALNGGNADWRSILNSAKKKIMDTASTAISDIQIDPGKKSEFYPYKSGVICLEPVGIRFYNINGKEEWNQDQSFSNPEAVISGNYILVWDNLAKTIYFFEGKNPLWSKVLEGEIITASINEKGFSGVIYKGTKSRLVVEVYDSKGNIKMTRYYSNNYAVDIRISPDNKNVAIGEMDVSGLKSSAGVGVIPVGTELYSSFFEEDSIFASMNYIAKDLILVLNSKIININPEGVKETVLEMQKEEVSEINLNSGKYIVLIKKTSKFLSAANRLNIINKNGKEIGSCDIIGRVINVDSDRDIIAINQGSRIIFVNSSGNEISQFNPKKEIKSVKLIRDGAHAAVIYPDHIDIVNIY